MHEAEQGTAILEEGGLFDGMRLRPYLEKLHGPRASGARVPRHRTKSHFEVVGPFPKASSPVPGRAAAARTAQRAARRAVARRARAAPIAPSRGPHGRARGVCAVAKQERAASAPIAASRARRWVGFAPAAPPNGVVSPAAARACGQCRLAPAAQAVVARRQAATSPARASECTWRAGRRRDQ